MPSPQVVAREPSRRIKKSAKPERRDSQNVEVEDDLDDTPTPSQQSKKAGPGAGGAGREAARRTNQRAPKVAGAKAKPQARTPIMGDKGADKKRADRLAKGETVSGSLTDSQPRRKGAAKQSRADQQAAKTPKRAAAAAEAAPTQKQVLKRKPPTKKPRTLRNEGVGKP